jgi:hypothetical protein
MPVSGCKQLLERSLVLVRSEDALLVLTRKPLRFEGNRRSILGAGTGILSKSCIYFSLRQALKRVLPRFSLIFMAGFPNPILIPKTDTMDTWGQHLGSSPFLDCWADVFAAALLYST